MIVAPAGLMLIMCGAGQVPPAGIVRLAGPLMETVMGIAGATPPTAVTVIIKSQVERQVLEMVTGTLVPGGMLVVPESQVMQGMVVLSNMDQLIT